MGSQRNQTKEAERNLSSVYIAIEVFRMYYPLMKQEMHTPPDVARLLGKSPVTIHEWIKAGSIQVHKIGARLFISNDELSRVIREMTTPFFVTDQE
jgi:Helix-turn-helix domain